MAVTELLNDYPVVQELTLHWGEMDALGHVNNVVYFRYFETARIAYFERTGIQASGDVHVGPILASTACRFRRPLTFPDRICVGARVTEIGDDRFTMEYALASERHGAIAAIGEGVVVSFDYRAGRKHALPAAWRERMLELEPQLRS